MKKAYRVFVYLFLSFFLCSPLWAEVIDINNEELQALMEKGVPLIDMRTPGEWQSTGVVAGSHKIMSFDERRNIDIDKWVKSIQGLAKPEDEVILICRSGNRTRMLGNYLSSERGYTKVYHLKDGMKGWKKASLPVIPVKAY